jgi:hypothetical protein
MVGMVRVVVVLTYTDVIFVWMVKRERERVEGDGINCTKRCEATPSKPTHTSLRDTKERDRR